MKAKLTIALLVLASVVSYSAPEQSKEQEKPIPATTGLFYTANDTSLKFNTNPTIVWTNVLTVSGLTVEAAPTTLGGISALYATTTNRPEKANDITVILYTKDGKRWRSKWVEDPNP